MQLQAFAAYHPKLYALLPSMPSIDLNGFKPLLQLPASAVLSRGRGASERLYKSASSRAAAQLQRVQLNENWLLALVIAGFVAVSGVLQSRRQARQRRRQSAAAAAAAAATGSGTAADAHSGTAATGAATGSASAIPAAALSDTESTRAYDSEPEAVVDGPTAGTGAVAAATAAAPVASHAAAVPLPEVYDVADSDDE
jgi:hypothetical protein